MRHTGLCLGVSVVLAVGSCQELAAAIVYPYALTPAQSEIDLQVSGTALGGALTVTEQNPNARTRYSGTVGASFHDGFGANSRISFPGSGTAVASNPTGFFGIPFQYSPGVGGGSGTAPANYGVNLTAPTNVVIPPIEIPNIGTISLGTLSQFTVRVALRETQLAVNSAAQISIDPGTREFDAGQLSINLSQGFADINGSVRFTQSTFGEWLAVGAALIALQASLPDLGLTINSNILQRYYDIGFGTRVDISGANLPNNPALPGVVTYNPLLEMSSLTIPINTGLGNIDFGIGNINLTLVGQLRGSASVPNIYHVPEPTSMLLAGWVGIIGLFHRRRLDAARR